MQVWLKSKSKNLLFTITLCNFLQVDIYKHIHRGEEVSGETWRYTSPPFNHSYSNLKFKKQDDLCTSNTSCLATESLFWKWSKEAVSWKNAEIGEQ